MKGAVFRLDRIAGDNLSGTPPRGRIRKPFLILSLGLALTAANRVHP